MELALVIFLGLMMFMLVSYDLKYLIEKYRIELAQIIYSFDNDYNARFINRIKNY